MQGTRDASERDGRTCEDHELPRSEHAVGHVAPRGGDERDEQDAHDDVRDEQRACRDDTEHCRGDDGPRRRYEQPWTVLPE